MVWSFIFLDPSLKDTVISEMNYDGGTILTCGVNSVDSGAQLALKLWKERHCELAELCGGFGPDGAKRVMAVTNNEVRVGYVTKKFPPEI